MQLDAFPGFALPTGDGCWRMLVSGAIRHDYLPTVRKRMLIRLLGNLMDATEDQLSSPEFLRRVTPFVADGAGKQVVQVRLGDQGLALRKRTRRNGHFSQWVTVPAGLVEACRETDRFGRALLQPEVLCEIDGQILRETAETWLVPATGTTIVSDVDDTIKESAIGDRSEMLANTFLREFRAVEGMAKLYRELADSGCAFHYVSSSPCQLLHALLGFRDGEGFPGGSLHLRDFRLRNHVLQKVARIRRSGKSKVIRRLIESQPGRRFILVGDAGERDLDLYRKVARRSPRQVAGIFIRRLADVPFPEERAGKCRDSLPGTLVGDFETADQLDRLMRRVLEASPERMVSCDPV
jgi:Uncharacterized conserved protein (DUF2183)